MNKQDRQRLASDLSDLLTRIRDAREAVNEAVDESSGVWGARFDDTQVRLLRVEAEVSVCIDNLEGRRKP